MPKDTPQDHKAEALFLLDAAWEANEQEVRTDPIAAAAYDLASASVHASLAQAEELGRVAEEVGGVRRELRHLNSKLHDAMTEPDCEEESR